MTIQVHVRITKDGIGYEAKSDEYPGYTAQGRTEDEARQNYKKGLAFSLRVPATDITLIEVNP